MKKNLSQYIALTLGLVLIAGASFAYNAPLGNPTEKNAFSYITKFAEPGVKFGDLAVATFTAAENAILKDQAIFQGTVTGGTTNPSTIKFGDGTYKVSAVVNNGLQVNNLQSDTLKHTDSALAHLCADAAGTYYLCDDGGVGGGTETDLCSNLAGAQTTVPQGYKENGDGTCSQVDQFVNFLGSTSTATSASLACTTLSASSRPYYRTLSAPPFPATSIIIYENSALTTPVNGGSKWYHVIYDLSKPSESDAIQIDNNGKTIATANC